MAQSTNVQTSELERFRRVQQLAYQCCEEIAPQLQPGVTERQVAKQMRRWLWDRGVDDFFHIPFAWFGDRTAFRGFTFPTQFLPSARMLNAGDPVTLDCAPVVDGYTADVGFSTRCGQNPAFDDLFAALAQFRPLILERVRARVPLRTIWAQVDELSRELGYENRHRVYPGHVLAHTVTRLARPLPLRPIAVAFGVRALETLLRELATERLQGRSPLWGPSRHSDHPPYPGLWAVEPHIGYGNVGGKWEEILVVTDNDAFWLDDNPSHVQRWPNPVV